MGTENHVVTLQDAQGVVSGDSVPKFTDETISSLKELGVVLRDIHDRLISEGYTIENGRIYKTVTIGYEEHH